MIQAVRIRRFKRFSEATLRLPDHVVLAGPNNTGKTTVLQAIASWSLGLRRWRELNDFNPRSGYAYAPIARQAFTSVPLRSFDDLWLDRKYKAKRRIEVELRHSKGWSVTMEFKADSTEQIYVRPRADTPPEMLRALDLRVVFVPPMTGVGIEEPVFQPPKIEQLLGLGRPGEALRNLLAEVGNDQVAWNALRQSIERLFGYSLLPPDASGPHIRAEYRMGGGEDATKPRFDLASAGSGFQQVLMLLAFLHARPGAVLLLDEPDAHLHVILQDAIYHELKTLAARQGSQLIVATHSEAVVNAAEPRELYVMLDQPKAVADTAERSRLVSSLRVLGNADIMQAQAARGILYVEDHTDVSILRAWAAQLGHRADQLLKAEAMWKAATFQTRGRGVNNPGVRSRDHFAALRLVREDLPGLELLDGDARPAVQDSAVAGSGLQRLRWRRYEIESYLLHPDSLSRFVETVVGGAAGPHIEEMLAYWRENFPPAIERRPLGDHAYLNAAKARKVLLPPLLDAAGIHGFPYTRYHEIAQTMRPEEIHPEVAEKLDAICRAFGVDP